MTAEDLRQLVARKCECKIRATRHNSQYIALCARCLAVDEALGQAADRIEDLEDALRAERNAPREYWGYIDWKGSR